MQTSSFADATDAVLTVSRVLVAVAARSLAGVDDDVTLPQYRALVVMCARGPQSMGALSEELGCSPSAATRLCDRLVRKRLISRNREGTNRREVLVEATQTGQDLVSEVTRIRRSEISRILRRMSPERRATMVESLTAFAEAADETPEGSWWLGWE